MHKAFPWCHKVVNYEGEQQQEGQQRNNHHSLFSMIKGQWEQTGTGSILSFNHFTLCFGFSKGHLLFFRSSV